MVYICRMSDCIVGLRLRVMALIILFFIQVSFSPYSFVSKFSQELLKIESLNLVYTWTMSCCKVGLRIGLLALILPFICPFFCLLRLNLCHIFLRNCTR